MRRLLLLGTLSGILMSFGVLAQEVPAPAEDLSPQAKKNREFYKGRSEQARRVNGVELKAKVKVVPSGQTEGIEIRWTLDYKGPRWPLIILEPTLEGYTSGQTIATFYAEGKDEKIHEFNLESRPKIGGFGSYSVPSMFLTIKKGEKATGTLTLSQEDLWIRFAQRAPEQFTGLDEPPKVSVQLVHKPYDRGEWYDLDAWTGTLHTPVFPVPLTVWGAGPNRVTK